MENKNIEISLKKAVIIIVLVIILVVVIDVEFAKYCITKNNDLNNTSNESDIILDDNYISNIKNDDSNNDFSGTDALDENIEYIGEALNNYTELTEYEYNMMNETNYERYCLTIASELITEEHQITLYENGICEVYRGMGCYYCGKFYEENNNIVCNFDTSICYEGGRCIAQIDCKFTCLRSNDNLIVTNITSKDKTMNSILKYLKRDYLNKEFKRDTNKVY